MITIVAGNLGKSAERRFTPTGIEVVQFSVAENIKDETHWYRCSWFGERALKACQYLTKGTRVSVTGRGKLNTWEKDGKTQASIDIEVLDLTMLGGGQREDGETEPIEAELPF